MIQAEKLASIGQMAAGVAHEINNPVGFVMSNLGTLEAYVAQLLPLAEAGAAAGQASLVPGLLAEAGDLEFLRTDIAALIAESRDGLARVKHIVQDLKSFSRGSADETWEMVDLHAALERAQHRPQ